MVPEIVIEVVVRVKWRRETGICELRWLPDKCRCPFELAAANVEHIFCLIQWLHSAPMMDYMVGGGWLALPPP